jgi:hypothetical protein
MEAQQPAPHLDGNRAVFDTSAWIRLPRPGTRCPVTGLSRSTLAELVRPCPRNDYRPPVEARVLKRRGAMRGVLLISRESLLGYLNELPPPESAKSPASAAREAAALAALREADFATIEARADLTDTAKTSIIAEIRAGKLKASDVAQPKASA